MATPILDDQATEPGADTATRPAPTVGLEHSRMAPGLLNDQATGPVADPATRPVPNVDIEPAPVIPADRWAGIHRPYSAADVERLRSSVRVHHTLAQVGARRLWELLTT